MCQQCSCSLQTLNVLKLESMNDTGGKKKVENFHVPPKCAKRKVQHGLLWACPVTFRSSSITHSSRAVSVHPALYPTQPWLCSAGSNPDKLLCLQAALSSAPNISSYFYPIPLRGVSLLIPVWRQLSTCRVIEQVPMKVTAVRSLHERIGPGFTLPPKNNHFINTGEDVKVALEHLSVGCLRAGKHWRKQVPTGSTVGWHGCSSIFIRVASLCVFWQRRIRAVSD